MLLSKDNLMQIKRKEMVLEVKEYDLEIKLRALSLNEQLKIEENSKQDKNLFVGNILKYCCIDNDGNNIFDTESDVEQLPAELSLIIFKECLKINNLQQKDVENLAKNS